MNFRKHKNQDENKNQHLNIKGNNIENFLKFEMYF